MQAQETEVKIPAGDRGVVIVDRDRCKGCELCVIFCPPKVLEQANELNAQGYNPARYEGSGCTGCAICFYMCPEPGAITVHRQGGKK